MSKKMELNLLGVTLNSTTKKELTKYAIYKYFLVILNEAQNVLTTKQIELLAFLMSKGQDFNINTRGSLGVISEGLSMSKQHISNVRTELKEKGLLLEDGKIHKMFRQIVVIVSQNEELTLKLPIKIKEDEY